MEKFNKITYIRKAYAGVLVDVDVPNNKLYISQNADTMTNKVYYCKPYFLMTLNETTKKKN